MKSTVPVKISKRKARDERLVNFQALANFANLGDTPDQLTSFRNYCRSNPIPFFPDYLTDWLYKDAQDWMEAVQDPKVTKEYPKIKRLNPPLLMYRGLLRAVWKNKDKDGKCLKFLLGFELDAIQTREVHLPISQGDQREPTPEEVGKLMEWTKSEEATRWNLWYTDPIPEEPTEQPPRIFFNGEIVEPTICKKQPTGAGLPSGSPVVDGKTGTITW